MNLENHPTLTPSSALNTNLSSEPVVSNKLEAANSFEFASASNAEKEAVLLNSLPDTASSLSSLLELLKQAVASLSPASKNIDSDKQAYVVDPSLTYSNMTEEDELLDEGDELLGEGDELLGEGDELLGEGDELIGEGNEALGETDELLNEGANEVVDTNLVERPVRDDLEDPLFTSVVEGSGIDFIPRSTSSDLTELTFSGREEVNLRDTIASVRSGLEDDDAIENAYVFEAEFENNGETTTLPIRLSGDFSSQAAAQEQAETVAEALGRIPADVRAGLRRIDIQEGNGPSLGFNGNRSLALYATDVNNRDNNNRLEEKLFLEAIQATQSSLFENTDAWFDAQDADSAFISEQAFDGTPFAAPTDFAETAFMAHFLENNPERLTPEIREFMRTNLSNRLEFIDNLDFEANPIPLFGNSITGEKIDLIQAGDPSALESLEFNSRGRRTFADNRDDEFAQAGILNNAFIFDATYDDGRGGSVTIPIVTNPDFSRGEAERYAEAVAEHLGQLPPELYRNLDQIQIQTGGDGDGGNPFSEGAEGSDREGEFSNERFIVLHADDIDERLEENHLAETLFHESVHASLDSRFLSNPGWLEAQRNDSTFISDNAALTPDQEDFADSALYAYALNKFPERVPADVREWLEANLPNRLSFLNGINAFQA